MLWRKENILLHKPLYVLLSFDKQREKSIYGSKARLLNGPSVCRDSLFRIPGTETKQQGNVAAGHSWLG